MTQKQSPAHSGEHIWTEENPKPFITDPLEMMGNTRQRWSWTWPSSELCLIAGPVRVQDQRGLILVWRFKNTRARLFWSWRTVSEPRPCFSSKKLIHIALCTRVRIQDYHCILLLLFLNCWLLLDFKKIYFTKMSNVKKISRDNKIF